MTRWWDQLGVSVVTGTAYTGITGSPYTPQANGRIILLRAVPAGDAATSLIERTDWRLKCKTFGGVDCIISSAGGGLRTAPASPIGPIDFPVDLPVQAGVPITIEAKHNVTAVTPNEALLALFEG
jgi:hypothetical protein